MLITLNMESKIQYHNAAEFKKEFKKLLSEEELNCTIERVKSIHNENADMQTTYVVEVLIDNLEFIPFSYALLFYCHENNQDCIAWYSQDGTSKSMGFIGFNCDDYKWNDDEFYFFDKR